MSIKIIETTTRFDRSLSKLPIEVQKEVLQRKAIFINNPFDRRLKTHKLKGRLKGFWSFSVTHSWRIIFEFIKKDEVVFYDIGDHQIYQ